MLIRPTRRDVLRPGAAAALLLARNLNLETQR